MRPCAVTGVDRSSGCSSSRDRCVRSRCASCCCLGTRRRIVVLAAESLCYVAAALPVSAYALQIFPWWRWPLATTVALIAGCDLVLACSRVRPLLGDGPGAGSLRSRGVTVTVLGVDLLTGTHLQLDGLLGDSTTVAGRFHGAGNGDFAVFATAALLSAGFVASVVARRGWAFAAAMALGVAALVLDGAPMFGDDFGGSARARACCDGAGVAAARRTAGAADLVGGHCGRCGSRSGSGGVRPGGGWRTHPGGSLVRRARTAHARRSTGNWPRTWGPGTAATTLQWWGLGWGPLRWPCGGRCAVPCRGCSLWSGRRARSLGDRMRAGSSRRRLRRARAMLNDSGVVVPGAAAVVGVPLVLAGCLRALPAETVTT